MKIKWSYKNLWVKIIIRDGSSVEVDSNRSQRPMFWERFFVKISLWDELEKLSFGDISFFFSRYYPMLENMYV